METGQAASLGSEPKLSGEGFAYTFGKSASKSGVQTAVGAHAGIRG